MDRLGRILRMDKNNSSEIGDFMKYIRNKYNPPNLIIYNNIISTLVRFKVNPKYIENVLNEMKTLELTPNSYTYHALLFHFCSSKSVEKAEILAKSMSDLNSTGNNSRRLIHVGITSLVMMYGKLNEPRKAREWFEKAIVRDLVLYNAMLQAYVDSCDWIGLHQIYQMMLRENMSPDYITFKIFFKSLLLQGKFIEAANIFHENIRHDEHLDRGMYMEMLKWTNESRFGRCLTDSEADATLKLEEALNEDLSKASLRY